jgi:hypothetical protein
VSGVFGIESLPRMSNTNETLFSFRKDDRKTFFSIFVHRPPNDILGSAATHTTKFVRSAYDVKHASLIAGLGKISAAQLHIIPKSHSFYRSEAIPYFGDATENVFINRIGQAADRPSSP